MTLMTDWQGQKVAGMFASEKLDGCRAYWDGRKLWTRGGNVIKLPSIVSKLPRGVHLDGEVHAGRGTLGISNVAVRLGRDSDRLRFTAFDAPLARGDWQKRMVAARKVWSDCVEHWVAGNFDDLVVRLRAIHKAGGEGIVLRKPEVAIYERCKTKNTLRFKEWSYAWE